MNPTPLHNLDSHEITYPKLSKSEAGTDPNTSKPSLTPSRSARVPVQSTSITNAPCAPHGRTHRCTSRPANRERSRCDPLDSGTI